MKGFINLLGKSGPGDLNRKDEPKIERESKKRSRGRLNPSQESSVPICFVTKHHYAALPSGWFSFSLFYILLFSIHIANVNTSNRSAVLNNLSVNIHAYGVSFNIYLQHVSVIIHFHWKLIKLRHTNVLYMLLNLVVIVPEGLSARDETRRKK